MSGSDFTVTPNYALYKPIAGADVGVWGLHWNANADVLDATLNEHAGAIDAMSGGFLPLTGGALTGPTTIIATGATTARSIQDRWHDTYNVRDFGAVMDGTTSDATAYNAAIAATPSLGKIAVPPGGFTYPGGTAAWASKPLLWQLSGNNFGTSTTPVNKIGNGLVETFLDTTTKFFARNATISAYGATTPTANLGPVVRIDSTIDHNGGPSGGLPGLLVSVSNTAASTAAVAPYGVVGQVIYNATNNPGSPGGCGIAGYGIRMSGAGPACPFGGNIYAEDHGLTTSGNGGSLVGCEIDIRAQRLDDGTLADGWSQNSATPYVGSNRIILDLKYARWNQSDNNQMEVGTALNIGLGTSADIPYVSLKRAIAVTHNVIWAGLDFLRTTFVGTANAIALPREARIAWTSDNTAIGSTGGSDELARVAIPGSDRPAVLRRWRRGQVQHRRQRQRARGGHHHRKRGAMIDARTPIAVSMSAERWQQVLNLMAEAPVPHRISDPLIRDIHQQCMAAAAQPSPLNQQLREVGNATS